MVTLALRINDKYYAIVEFQHVNQVRAALLSAIRLVIFALAALLIKPATLVPSLRTFFCSPKRCSTSTTTVVVIYFMDNKGLTIR